jgi:hypothetical protein
MMGFVYILKNPSFGDDWVKIGQTNQDDVENRVNQLNQSEATPFAFRIFATYEVDDPLKVEREIHGLFDEIHYELRARETVNGRNRVREFFHISPESAFRIFNRIAAWRGDAAKLKLYAPNDEQREAEEEAETLSIRRTRARNTTFEMIGIEINTELTFLSDDSCVCRTLDSKNKVEYDNESFTITALALKIGKEKFDWTGSNVNGFEYFTFNGETLWNRRKRMECETIENLEQENI